jgi:hypothetical protein
MLCALVTEEIAEPGEGVMFCAILPVLPTLSVCSPPTKPAIGGRMMSSMMMGRRPVAAGSISPTIARLELRNYLRPSVSGDLLLAAAVASRVAYQPI